MRLSLRAALLFVVAALLVLPPALAGAKRIELLASTALNSNGNSSSFTLSTVRELMVGVDVTAGSGTSPTLDLWLQGSDDGGTTWYDLVADQVLPTADAAASGTVTTSARDIVDNKTTTTAESFVAVYKSIPTDRIRLKWKIGGTSPEFTLSVSAVGK